MKALAIAFEPADLPRLAGFAQALGVPFDILLLGGEAEGSYGSETLLTARLGEIPPADGLAEAVGAIAADYTHIAALSSMRSKDLLGRLTGVLDAAAVTDVVRVIDPLSFECPMVAGSVLATVRAETPPVVLTARAAGFAPAGTAGPISSQAVELPLQGRTRRVSLNARQTARPDLASARVVVSGGRPLRDAQTFEALIGGLADDFGGAVGATRAAVDAGIASNELQVGQTGKTVAPELYIAAGISGSTQHMAGMKDSKTVVAINKDPGAPIFEIADLGLVADLFDAIPEIRRLLRPVK